jgi:hypothetical protein
MSDVLEVVITQEDLELSFEGATELVFVDDGLELTVVSDAEIVINDEVIELLTDSEPGIPSGGLVGQVLAKASSSSFDVQWVMNTKITVGTTAPTTPTIGDLWVDTN